MFPNEIVYNILSFLRWLNHFFAAKLVCKDWYQMYLLIQKDNKMNHKYFEIHNITQQIIQNCELISPTKIKAQKPQIIYNGNYFRQREPFEFYCVANDVCVKLLNDKYYILHHGNHGSSNHSVYLKNQGNHTICFHKQNDDCLFTIRFHQHKKPTIEQHNDDLCFFTFGRLYYTSGKFIYNFVFESPHLSNVTEVIVFKKSQDGSIEKHSHCSFSLDVKHYIFYFSCGYIFVPYLKLIFDLQTMEEYEYSGKWKNSFNTKFLFYDFDHCFVWNNGKAYQVIFQSKKIKTKKFTTIKNLTIGGQKRELTEVMKVQKKLEFELIRCENYDIPDDISIRLVESEETMDFFFVAAKTGAIYSFDHSSLTNSSQKS